MPWNDKVVWSEGLFLEPQHFQQHDRYWERRIEGRTQPLLGYAWGFVSIELDRTALALGKIQLTAARGIFPDGTPFDFPAEDAPPIALEVEGDVHDELVMLALPLKRPGSDEADYSELHDRSLARYAIGELEVRDSNASSNQSSVVQVGRLRTRLMRKRDVTDAYTTLGFAHVLERRADNNVALSASYVPPMLHAASDMVLGGYVREIHGQLHQRAEALAERMSQRGLGGVAELGRFLMLQTVNRYEPLFAHFTAHSLLHPERVYSTCVQLAGELETFTSAKTRTSALPDYQHDNLEQTFGPLLARLRDLLNIPFRESAVPIELKDLQYGLKVGTLDLELVKNASLVLAAEAQLPADVLRARLPMQMKVGPTERIRDLVNLQLPGISLQPLPVVPRQIPFHAGRNYFELQRRGDLWKQLERSGGLAMHIGGDFPGLELELWAIRSE
jgi:type VI secretion system protein ImpJ